VVQEDEPVFLVYSCKNSQGELVVTTAADTAVSEEKKAAIFTPLPEPGPVAVTAGKKHINFIHSLSGPADFDQAATAYLAAAIVGQPFNRSLDITIRGEVQKGITDSNRFLKMYRREWKPRKFWSPNELWKAEYGKQPQLGDVYPSGPYPETVFYKIVAINDQKAQAEVMFENNSTVENPFGRLRFVNVDDKQRYQVVTDTQVGHTVRSGSLVGRVTAVDHESWTVDYGDPLAGLTLQCETTVSPANH
jgi:hypothetical protein